MTLRLIAIGALGNMLGPSAKHLLNNPAAVYLRVLDRGGVGESRDKFRMAWKLHGVQLVATITQLVADGDFDGVVICVGKNGDDYFILKELVALLQPYTSSHHYFILH